MFLIFYVLLILHSSGNHGPGTMIVRSSLFKVPCIVSALKANIQQVWLSILTAGISGCLDPSVFIDFVIRYGILFINAQNNWTNIFSLRRLIIKVQYQMIQVFLWTKDKTSIERFWFCRRTTFVINSQIRNKNYLVPIKIDYSRLRIRICDDN